MIYVKRPGRAVVDAAKVYRDAIDAVLKASPTAAGADSAAQGSFERLLSAIRVQDFSLPLDATLRNPVELDADFDEAQFRDNETRALADLLLERLSLAQQLFFDVRVNEGPLPESTEALVALLTDRHRIVMQQARDARRLTKAEKKKRKREIVKAVNKIAAGAVVVSANVFAAVALPWQTVSVGTGVGLIANGTVDLINA